MPERGNRFQIVLFIDGIDLILNQKNYKRAFNVFRGRKRADYFNVRRAEDRTRRQQEARVFERVGGNDVKVFCRDSKFKMEFLKCGHQRLRGEAERIQNKLK